MADRLALIIASYRFEDEGLRSLVAPAQDADALERVLKGPGNFQVKKLVNEPSRQVGAAIEDFFDDRKRDDLLLLYYSGHGIKDESGRLYFTTPDTRRRSLRFTAIPAASVHDIMLHSRSRSQILLLDCCYSGAFAKGAVAKSGSIGDLAGTGEQLKGQGRIVLTASDSLQYAFEGDQVSGQAVRSVFTDALVNGLETGRADLDQDGRVTINELYDYVHDQVTSRTPQQRPEKWEFGVQGAIVVARNPSARASMAALPDWVAMALASQDASARIVAIGELSKLLQSGDKRLAKIAESELKRLAQKDPDPMVSGAASGALKHRAYTTQPGLTRLVLDRDRATSQWRARPSLALRLSPKPAQVNSDEQATWTVTVTNDGDDLLRQVRLARFKSELVAPFDLPAGKSRSFTFTTSYQSWGTKTQTVTASGTASDGRQIQREASGELHVRKPGSTPPQAVPRTFTPLATRGQRDILQQAGARAPRSAAPADDVLSRVQEVVADILGVNTKEVVPSASFADTLFADELDLVEIVLALEQEFDVMIPDEQATAVATVGDLVALVKRLRR